MTDARLLSKEELKDNIYTLSAYSLDADVSLALTGVVHHIAAQAEIIANLSMPMRLVINGANCGLDLQSTIAVAKADGRAEAFEAAAQECDVVANKYSTTSIQQTAAALAKRIRALAEQEKRDGK